MEMQGKYTQFWEIMVHNTDNLGECSSGAWRKIL